MYTENKYLTVEDIVDTRKLYYDMILTNIAN